MAIIRKWGQINQANKGEIAALFCVGGSQYGLKIKTGGRSLPHFLPVQRDYAPRTASFSLIRADFPERSRR